ncbi:MAG: aconitate hydratase AcnA, partial [Alphaproteobacteria bacterium]|nr:aconitate hydratase AcnA [Alphaproteobacteria bacterium]
SELQGTRTPREVVLASSDHGLRDGDVVIAAITSCTNTSNPGVMLAAGLLARNAVARGLKTKPWVKASLAPGSRVVEDYLKAAGVQDDLNALGFNIVGIGCTTCIGNSGPLAEPVTQAIGEGNLAVCSVLSGNRNFEGRISPHVKANYLASPPLVVAYALAGTMIHDLLNEPLGKGSDGEEVFLKDIWPTNTEISETLESALSPDMFHHRYSDVFEGTPEWQAVETTPGPFFCWDDASTYVRNPPYFSGMAKEVSDVENIENARILALLGDSVTTDHISPAGSIPEEGPAGAYLTWCGVAVRGFNSFGARRGNHEIMMRGTFANIRLANEMVPGTTGGVTLHMPSGEQMTIFDAAARYREEKVPLIVVAGKDYGIGSSRDWAAKGLMLLGVRAVIAESFERIHRSNLVGMGILPLQFREDMGRKTLGLDGSEVITISGIAECIRPHMDVTATITKVGGGTETVSLLCRIDTLGEVEYYCHGGILPYVLRSLLDGTVGS